MKIKALSLEQLNALILDANSDPFEIMDQVHLWEMANGRKFVYPHNGKNHRSSGSIQYLHPDFGWVPELR